MPLIGVGNLKTKLNKLKNIDVKPIIEDATARLKDEARKNAPVDTGELLKSIKYKVDEKDNCIVGTVFSNKDHAVYVEFGTGPKGQENHQGISPEVKPIYTPTGWVYYDENKGQFFYTKGQPARPFMYSTLHNNLDKYSEFIISRIQKLMKEATND